MSMSTLSKLPFNSFALTGSQTNGVGRAWQLDIDLEANRPMKFFGLSVFYDGPSDNPLAIDELNQRISDTIRYHKQLLSGHRVSVTNEDFFEQSLQKINAEMNVFLRDWNGPLPIQSWAMVLAMIVPDSSGRLQFFISRFGDISAWLLHTAQLDTKKMINIFDAPDPVVHTGGPQKFFKNILSSSLALQDQLLFCTPNLFQYASLSDVKKILTTLSVSSAIKQMENHVSEALLDPVAAAMSMRLSPYPFVETTAVQTKGAGSAQRSMQTLTRTESETEQLLSTSVGVNFKRISGFFKQFGSTLRRYSEDTDKTVHSGRNGKDRAGWLRPLVKGLSNGARALSALVARLFALLPRRSKSASKSPMGRADFVSTNSTVTRASALQTYTSSLSAGAGRIFSSLMGRGKKGRPDILRSPKAYVAFLLITVLVGGGLYWRSVKAKEAQIFADAQTAIEEISKDLDRVDSHLIARRERDALLLVNEADTKLAAVTALPELASDRDQLTERLEDFRRKLRKEITVTPGIILDDLPTELNGATKQIVPTETGILVFGQNPRNVLEYVRGENTKTVHTLVTDLNAWDHAMWIENDQVAFSDGKSITTASLNRGTATTQPLGDSTIAALATYNRRLYALSPTTNQIMRSGVTPNLSSMATWLEEPDTALVGAKDLAIDGSIYVLLSNGMRLYVQGALASGPNLDTVEPALTQATRLSYEVDGQYFFILEKKRVLVYRKTGAFVAQYLLESGAEMKDLYVDEASKTAFVLTDSQLLSFPIQI
jgi:hypothetical protein